MKDMVKKVLPIPLATVLLTALGGILRQWYLDTAVDSMGLLIPGAPAATALVIFAALAAVCILVLVRVCMKGLEYGGYLEGFHCRSALMLIFRLLGAALLAANACACLKHYFDVIDNGGRGLLTLALSVVWALWAVAEVGGAFLAWSSRAAKGRERVLLLIPGYCSCAWFISIYQQWASYPNRLNYIFFMLGVAAVMFALYSMAGFSFEKKKPHAKRFVWYSAMACILLMTDVISDYDYFMRRYLTRAWVAAFLLLQMTLLLYRGVHPPVLERTEEKDPDGPETDAEPPTEPETEEKNQEETQEGGDGE